MSVGEEMNELRERAEEAAERKGLAPVSLTMAVVAVLVATISLLGHRAHTEEILLQNKVTDTWAQYQAKSVRAKNLESLDEVLSVIGGGNQAKTEEVHHHFQSEADRYRTDQEKISEQAKELGTELEQTSHRADRFDLGEVFLEIALVVTSITLLTGRKHYWMLGMVMAAAGIAIATSVWFLH
ncbi:MAG TPA: DUF4337 domain-containing protein [Candidatus Angelobacter sp.]|nr:DUF4337 domain-containing protein [Candidatus Angelobacter sp.]